MRKKKKLNKGIAEVRARGNIICCITALSVDGMRQSYRANRFVSSLLAIWHCFVEECLT